jgi:multicomponent Na+:H+ antiporter subunit A
LDLSLIILSSLVLAVLAPFIDAGMGRFRGIWVALLPLCCFGLLLRYLPAVGAGPVEWTATWWPSLGLSLSIYLDGLSLLFALIITGVGTLVMIYTRGYFGDPAGRIRFLQYMLLFMSAMLGVVLSGNLVTMFVFWELTSVASYLLIGFKHEDESTRRAALQALLVTATGGLALLAGIILIGQVVGSYEFGRLLASGEALREHPHYLPILLLVCAGAFTKSAQFPFHFWLPGAMSAPTPASAYLHSATMVKAGIYLLLRLAPILGKTAEWHYIVGLTGLVTMAVGGALALGQTDMKRLLAYTTVSALGILTMLVGFDTTLSVKAGLVFLLVHSLYKAALFMVAGIVDVRTGTRDVTRLMGLARAFPMTAVAAGLAALSMTGFPPLLGFIGKELMYEAKIQTPGVGAFAIVLGVFANAANVAVAVMVGLRPFWPRTARDGSPAGRKEAPALWVGVLLLGITGLLFGLYPDFVSGSLISPALNAVSAEFTDVKLKLWHGVNPVLMLSIATVLLGLVLFRVRGVIRSLSSACARISWVTPTRVYQLLLDGVLRLAETQTRVLQNGRLRYYLTTVLCVVVLLAGYPLFRAGEWRRSVSVAAPSVELVVVCLVMVLSAFVAVSSRSRLGAIAALGFVGYAVSIVFVLYGAADLAITQVLVETLTVIVFVLAVYHLPRFTRFSTRLGRARDAVVAGLFGLTMAALVYTAQHVQIRPAISEYFTEFSWIKAYGRNVVNVILVDFRALDTLGEITVLTIAAIGVFSLIRFRPGRESSHRRTRDSEAAGANGGGSVEDR